MALGESGRLLEPRGATMTFAPRARNSVVRRRLASTCKLRRAAGTAAPAPKGKRMGKSRARMGSRRGRMKHQKKDRFLVRRARINRPAGEGPAHNAKRGP